MTSTKITISVMWTRLGSPPPHWHAYSWCDDTHIGSLPSYWHAYSWCDVDSPWISSTKLTCLQLVSHSSSDSVRGPVLNTDTLTCLQLVWCGLTLDLLHTDMLTVGVMCTHLGSPPPHWHAYSWCDEYSPWISSTTLTCLQLVWCGLTLDLLHTDILTVGVMCTHLGSPPPHWHAYSWCDVHSPWISSTKLTCLQLVSHISSNSVRGPVLNTRHSTHARFSSHVLEHVWLYKKNQIF